MLLIAPEMPEDGKPGNVAHQMEGSIPDQDLEAGERQQQHGRRRRLVEVLPGGQQQLEMAAVGGTAAARETGGPRHGRRAGGGGGKLDWVCVCVSVEQEEGEGWREGKNGNKGSMDGWTERSAERRGAKQGNWMEQAGVTDRLVHPALWESG